MAITSAAGLLAAWEAGLAEAPAGRALLLHRTARPDVDTGLLPRLPVGEREADLFALRRALFGERMQVRLECTACGEDMEFELNAEELARSLGGGEGGGSEAGSRRSSLGADGSPAEGDGPEAGGGAGTPVGRGGSGAGRGAGSPVGRDEVPVPGPVAGSVGGSAGLSVSPDELAAGGGGVSSVRRDELVGIGPVAGSDVLGGSPVGRDEVPVPGPVAGSVGGSAGLSVSPDELAAGGGGVSSVRRDELVGIGPVAGSDVLGGSPVGRDEVPVAGQVAGSVGGSVGLGGLAADEAGGLPGGRDALVGAGQVAGMVDAPGGGVGAPVRQDDVSGAGHGDSLVRVQQGGWDVEFRLPGVADLAAAARDADPRGALLARCLVSAAHDGAPVTAKDLPAAVQRRIAEAAEAADPGADLALNVACPECGRATRAELDIASYLWTELDAWARDLLLDVHLLATAYGWSEPEILALSPLRRRYYLELCADV